MDNHWFETRLRIDGTLFSESMLMSVSTNTSLFSGNPEIGKAIAGELDVTMIAPSISIPRMAKVEPFVRICGKMVVPRDVSSEENTLGLDNGSSVTQGILTVAGAEVDESIVKFYRTEYKTVQSEWIRKGVFYIDTRETSKNEDGLNILNFHAYDAMLFAEQEYASTKLKWPAVDINIVKEIASTMGVTVDDQTKQIMTGGYALPLPSGYTLREVLGYIASMYVGSFVMTDTGKLRLISILSLPTETNYMIDNAGDAIVFGEDRILV